MTESARRYPLSWPIGWTRTPAAERKRADFGKTVEKTYTERHYDGRPPETKTRKSKAPLSASDAAVRLEAELDRLDAEDAKLSTSQKLRIDGTPRSDLSEPADVGAAVYFTLNGQSRVLACDRWTRVADNIAAIAQHIDALRRIERYGIGDLNQAFAGYAALPPRGGTEGGDWRAEFEIAATEHLTLDQVEAQYRTLLKRRHPDAGGSHEAVVRLNRARDEARAYFRSEAGIMTRDRIADGLMSTQLADLAGRGLHRSIADQVPSLKRVRVWCHTCGYTTVVDSARCLATRWPEHCGQTMSIDSPDERAARRSVKQP